MGEPLGFGEFITIAVLTYPIAVMLRHWLWPDEPKDDDRGNYDF